MRIAYKEPKNFRAKSLALIALCNEILADFRSQGYSLTLRQLYYQLVGRAVIENNDRSYDNLGALISDARLAGLVDWDDIVDRTRAARSLSHWDKPSDIIKGAAGQFNYDKWADQSHRVEVWVEKDALVDVVGQACNPLDVAFFSCRGYTSQTAMWNAAHRLMGYRKDGAERVTILHLGDHDPSGLDMTRDITERLAGFCEYHGYEAPVVERIALNMDQIRKYNPPPNPAKESDCRSPKYIEQYGPESWELDALNPKVISDLVRVGINKRMDKELFEAQCERQAQARRELAEISSNYDGLLVGQRELTEIAALLDSDEHDTAVYKGMALDVAAQLGKVETLGEEVERQQQINVRLSTVVGELKTENVSLSGTLDIVNKRLEEVRAGLAAANAKLAKQPKKKKGRK